MRSPAARRATVSREPLLLDGFGGLDDPPLELELGSDAAVRSPAARRATVSRDPLFCELELLDELLGDRATAVRRPASREATVSREPLLFDDELFDDELDECEEDEGADVGEGDRSARLPEPVSRAMLVSYGVTVTVPTAPVALSDPIHISSSRTTVSTPALENTMPGTRP